jgi:hypothetical protein
LTGTCLETEGEVEEGREVLILKNSRPFKKPFFLVDHKNGQFSQNGDFLLNCHIAILILDPTVLQ